MINDNFIIFAMNKKTKQMKKFTSTLFFIALLCIPFYFAITHQPNKVDFIFQGMIFILILLFMFNLIARNYLIFKSYFTSPFNILIESQKETFKYDLSKDLMLPKLIESIKRSKLHLTQKNEEMGSILATSSMSWKSWGENVYITLIQKENYTEVILEMTTISQVTSWGRNKKHHSNILNQFENSLTI